jgi:hypothetical protein
MLIQLTHSMFPLSLLIIGCYTCSIYRRSLDNEAGTSIATYEGDNGSSKMNGNIECTSMALQESLYLNLPMNLPML